MIGLAGPSLAPASGEAPREIIMLLHGYGSNGADLLGLAPFWQPGRPHALFLAPNAPEPCPGMPDGYQWWGLASFDRATLAAGVARAAPVLDAYIDEQLARHGLAEDRLVLVGFSQGTMMALHAGPMRARRIAGIIGFSGILATPFPAPPPTKPPILLIHGDADAVVPVAGFHQSRDELLALGFPVEGHVTRGLAHAIDAEGLRLGAAFIDRILG